LLITKINSIFFYGTKYLFYFYTKKDVTRETKGKQKLVATTVRFKKKEGKIILK
jgi:hypothetical protein